MVRPCDDALSLRRAPTLVPRYPPLSAWHVPSRQTSMIAQSLSEQHSVGQVHVPPTQALNPSQS